MTTAAPFAGNAMAEDARDDSNKQANWRSAAEVGRVQSILGRVVQVEPRLTLC